MDTDKNINKRMCANRLTPAYPTHPGEILKDEIECRGISQRKLATQMGMQYSVLNEILNAHRPLTEKTALLFEAALNVDAETLMRLQLKPPGKTNHSWRSWRKSAKLPLSYDFNLTK